MITTRTGMGRLRLSFTPRQRKENERKIALSNAAYLEQLSRDFAVAGMFGDSNDAFYRATKQRELASQLQAELDDEQNRKWQFVDLFPSY